MNAQDTVNTTGRLNVGIQANTLQPLNPIKRVIKYSHSKVASADYCYTAYTFPPQTALSLLLARYRIAECK